jgi:hypothetical protein
LRSKWPASVNTWLIFTKRNSAGEMQPMYLLGFHWRQGKSIQNPKFNYKFIFIGVSELRQYTVDYKLDTYLKIARLYLEDDDPVQAEAFINRASLLQV